MSATLTLPARLDFNAARPLAAELGRLAGQDLELDASEVTHLGALCLQVLLAAAQSWRGAGLALRLTGGSPAMDEGLALFGIDPDGLAARAIEVAA